VGEGGGSSGQANKGTCVGKGAEVREAREWECQGKCGQAAAGEVSRWRPPRGGSTGSTRLAAGHVTVLSQKGIGLNRRGRENSRQKRASDKVARRGARRSGRSPEKTEGTQVAQITAARTSIRGATQNSHETGKKNRGNLPQVIGRFGQGGRKPSGRLYLYCAQSPSAKRQL